MFLWCDVWHITTYNFGLVKGSVCRTKANHQHRSSFSYNVAQCFFVFCNCGWCAAHWTLLFIASLHHYPQIPIIAFAVFFVTVCNLQKKYAIQLSTQSFANNIQFNIHILFLSTKYYLSFHSTKRQRQHTYIHLTYYIVVTFTLRYVCSK